MFTVTAGAGDEIDAGRRAAEAVEAGLDLGTAGGPARMNLVRGYLLAGQARRGRRGSAGRQPG